MRNGQYILRLTQYRAKQLGRDRDEVVATQFYGSLQAATRDADVFVKHGDCRQAVVTHEAANGVCSLQMYAVQSETMPLDKVI